MRVADPAPSSADDTSYPEIRGAIRDICARFGDEYWRDQDRLRRYPSEFVDALTEAGWFAALIPEEYGGSGLGIAEATAVLRRSSAKAATPRPATPTCTSWARCSSTAAREQKRRYLPRIAKGELRLQAFGVTEPTAGSETTRIRTTAVRSGDSYIVNGQKIWTSRFRQSDLMLLLVLLLVRTTPARSSSTRRAASRSSSSTCVRPGPTSRRGRSTR